MRINFKFVAIPIIVIAVAVGYQNCGSNSSGGGGSGNNSVSALSNQLISAELVKSWQSQSTGFVYALRSDGTFSNSSGTWAGNVSSITPTPQSQCLAGIATCGIVVMNVTTSPGGNYMPVGANTCSYQTYSYNLMLNCGGGAAASQLFQWVQ